MKTNRILLCLSLLIAALLILSCGKNEMDALIEKEVIPDPPPQSKVEPDPPYVNLESSITFDATESIEEGEFVQFTVDLGTKLSEIVPIQFEFHTDSLINFLNENDYSTLLEYSSDAGSTWTQSQNNTANIPKETTSLRIRFQTLDDSDLEVHESLFVQLEALPQNNVKLTNTLSATFLITVNDNEDNGYDFFGGFMTYRISESYDFQLISVARTVTSTLEKSFIDDQKLPATLLEDVRFALQSGGIRTDYFIAKHEPEGNLGSVYNLGFEGHTDRWVLNMNLFYAYNDIQKEIPIAYNENGHFGNTLVHELGHLLTLNYRDQVDTTAPTVETCPDYFNETYGCMKEEASLSLFDEAFYNGKELEDFAFVTGYAKTSITEDIAETFIFYVAQDSIPAVHQFTSIALQKINFLKTDPWLSSFKKLKDSIYLDLEVEYGPWYYKRRRGTPIRSCLEVGQEEKRRYLRNRSSSSMSGANRNGFKNG